MALHVLHFTIIGNTFNDIEKEAARRVADYTGWGIRQARARIDEHAHIEAHPTGHTLDGDTIGYTAEVTVSV